MDDDVIDRSDCNLRQRRITIILLFFFVFCFLNLESHSFTQYIVRCIFA